MLIDLQGSQGNAFALIGLVNRLLVETGQRDRVREVTRKLMASDYHHLLATMEQEFPDTFAFENDPREPTKKA